MKSVAVIAEFNPFHNGHARLLRSIREKMGEDTAVTAIMSGWFVQRGDLAVASPYVRAECALRAGYDLVLELPFPYSCSSAEYFAGAGVSLADGLACFDAIAFGCECGELERLCRVADAKDSEAYAAAMEEARKTEEGRRIGYAALSREAISALLSEPERSPLMPNDTLAVEYLRAMRRISSRLQPIAIARVGQDYHDKTLHAGRYASASALRTLLQLKKYEELGTYIEAESLNPLLKAIHQGDAPASLDQLSDAILAFFIAPSVPFSKVTDEASMRLKTAALDALDLGDLIRRFTRKTDTEAHAHRTLLHAYFGVTSSELCAGVRYTRVLGFRDRGRELLRVAKRKGSVALLTKTADYVTLPPEAARQAERSLRADRIAGLSLPARRPAADAYRGVPCHIRASTDE